MSEHRSSNTPNEASPDTEQTLRRREILDITCATVLTSGFAGCASDDLNGRSTGTVPAGDTPTATETPGAEPVDFEFDQRFDSHVDASGTEFVVDGETVHPTGGNHPQLRRQDFEAQVAWFEQWADVTDGSLDALRATAWGTASGHTALQPEPGAVGEEGFKRLDRLVALAGHFGVRLVLPLANFWDWQGGVATYQDWFGFDRKSDFYTDQDAQNAYHQHIENVLRRENHLTGVTYKDDPTVLLWELMNEPRLGDATEDEFVAWVRESTEQINGIDSNHLVSTGLGGGSVVDPPNHYTRANDLDTVDAWSFHIWADPRHQDLGVSGGVEWLRNHTQAAHDLDMPAYAGEFGWPVDRTDTSDDSSEIDERHDVFEEWLAELRREDTNGALIWDLRHDTEHPLGWNRYGVFPRDPGTEALLTNQFERFDSAPSTDSG